MMGKWYTLSLEVNINDYIIDLLKNLDYDIELVKTKYNRSKTIKKKIEQIRKYRAILNPNFENDVTIAGLELIKQHKMMI